MSFIKTKREGIFKNAKNGKFLARITIEGTQKKKAFDSEFEAIKWRLAMENKEPEPTPAGKTSTLKLVWLTMQEKHFPTLQGSTQRIWLRRYTLLKDLENYQMSEITTAKVTTWIEEKVKFFKGDKYEAASRGLSKRCNLDNELNLLTTIFNWYKTSEDYNVEAANLSCPVTKNHKKKGFIRPKPVKDKAITLDAALQFFSHLKPLYRDLALMQFYTASRVGEVAGLQWSRIDFENRRVTIMETCEWDDNKVYIGINKTPKNKEARPVYMTKEIQEALERRLAFKEPGCDFVFHVQGVPLNYSTIQANYREGQRKSKVPYRGTHILRHGMAKLARQVGGGLDAVVAMTGHKDLKLANHYSKLDSEFQKETSEKIMDTIRKAMSTQEDDTFENVIKFAKG